MATTGHCARPLPRRTRGRSGTAYGTARLHQALDSTLAAILEGAGFQTRVVEPGWLLVPDSTGALRHPGPARHPQVSQANADKTSIPVTKGEFDLDTGASLAAFGEAAMTAPAVRRIVLDMSNATFADSSLLNLVLTIRRSGSLVLAGTYRTNWSTSMRRPAHTPSLTVLPAPAKSLSPDAPLLLHTFP